jgi:hypothetical protein
MYGVLGDSCCVSDGKEDSSDISSVNFVYGEGDSSDGDGVEEVHSRCRIRNVDLGGGCCHANGGGC